MLLQGWQDVIPYEVLLSLHVVQLGCIDDYSIFLWNDDDVLPASSISTERIMAATPHLVAITLHPITILERLPALVHLVCPDL